MHEIIIKTEDIRTVRKIMDLMENEKKLAEKEASICEEKEYYKELIDGKRESKNITEHAISKAKEFPEMALAEIGLNHPATEIIFGFLEEKYNVHPLAYLSRIYPPDYCKNERKILEDMLKDNSES